MAMHKVEFLFLGGPADRKRLTMPVYDLERYPNCYEVQEELEGFGFKRISYNRRVLVTSTGYSHTIYCDSRLSEDEQNALVYAWAREHLL